MSFSSWDSQNVTTGIFAATFSVLLTAKKSAEIISSDTGSNCNELIRTKWSTSPVSSTGVEY